VAHRHGAVVIVDNTLATPINQHPVKLGEGQDASAGTAAAGRLAPSPASTSKTPFRNPIPGPFPDP
jgi:hypothetical protein